MSVYGKVVEKVKEKGGVILITADHGNSEQMIDYKTGEPHTAHTTNPVPLILFGMEGVTLKSRKTCRFSAYNVRYNGVKKTRRNDRRKFNCKIILNFYGGICEISSRYKKET